MYIDFHKYNYDLLNKHEKSKYIARDKESYKKVLRNWLETNIKEIVERKWEIVEILYLKETSDFIKLLKEAESLYELGFFTSCIALVGVSAEDFTKYIALKTNNSDLLNKSISQATRLKALYNNKVIVKDIYDDLDDIREVRNDCLHFNEDFKRKKFGDLKKDALRVLCALKRVIESIIGVRKDINSLVSFNELSNIVEKLVEEMKSDGKFVKGFDDIILRLRNAVSHLFYIPIAFEPDKRTLIFQGIYRVKEINFDLSNFGEIDLIDQTKDNFPVIVDLDEDTKQKLKDLRIKKGNRLFAIIYSNIDEFGLSSVWKFLDFRKL